MEEIKVSSKGQIVIPKYIRDAMGLTPGKSVMITKIENKIVLIPKSEDPVKEIEKAGQDISLKNIRRDIKGE